MSGAGEPRRECDDCRTMGAALASGYDPTHDSSGWSDFVEPCTNAECRWYEPPPAAPRTDVVRVLQREGLYVW